MAGKIIGYIRVSSFEQNPERQLDSLKLDKTFIDKASGKDVKRPQLEAMLNYVRDGDTVIVHSMDRMARNLDDLRRLVNELTHRHVAIQFIKENLKFTGEDSPMANLLLSVMGAFAEFERAMLRERTKAGLISARKQGRIGGRKPKFESHQLDEIVRMVTTGEKTAAEVARLFEVHPATISRILARKSVSA